jgi:dethiobiotin synthetase
MAKHIIHQQKTVITQKYIQTGCENMAEDLLVHRKLMNTPLTKEDKSKLTCSYLFKYPASPHFSAKLENKSIEPDTITSATEELSKKYDIILMEGAGGLMVPIVEKLTLLDYVKTHNYPCILVSSSNLGSINHTLLSLEVLKQNNIDLLGVVYNEYPNNSQLITDDSKKVIKSYLKDYYPNAGFVSIPEIDIENAPIIDFSSIIKL